MGLPALILAFSLLSVSVEPFLVEAPSPEFPEVETPQMSASQENQEEPWSEMTIIKTHYDCRGLPMWREVSKIKSKIGQSVEVVKTSRETFETKKENSATEGAPAFFKSMRSRLRTAVPRPTVTPSTANPRPPLVLEVGGDRIIATPIISCPEGYNEDYNGHCRPVFPEP